MEIPCQVWLPEGTYEWIWILYWLPYEYDFLEIHCHMNILDDGYCLFEDDWAFGWCQSWNTSDFCVGLEWLHFQGWHSHYLSLSILIVEDIPLLILSINWLVVRNISHFSIYWVSNHPNWRTHIFAEGWLNHQPVNSSTLHDLIPL